MSKPTMVLTEVQQNTINSLMGANGQEPTAQTMTDMMDDVIRTLTRLMCDECNAERTPDIVESLRTTLYIQDELKLLIN